MELMTPNHPITTSQNAPIWRTSPLVVPVAIQNGNTDLHILETKTPLDFVVDFLQLVESVQAVYTVDKDGVNQILISCSDASSKTIETISSVESNIIDFMISLYGASGSRPKLDFHVLPPTEGEPSKGNKIFDRKRQRVRSYANESRASAPSPEK